MSGGARTLIYGGVLVFIGGAGLMLSVVFAGAGVLLMTAGLGMWLAGQAWHLVENQGPAGHRARGAHGR